LTSEKIEFEKLKIVQKTEEGELKREKMKLDAIQKQEEQKLRKIQIEKEQELKALERERLKQFRDDEISRMKQDKYYQQEKKAEILSAWEVEVDQNGISIFHNTITNERTNIKPPEYLLLEILFYLKWILFKFQKLQ